MTLTLPRRFVRVNTVQGEARGTPVAKARYLNAGAVMRVHLKIIAAIAGAALAGAAAAQPATSSVGRAASAAVTPGDQNMGRNPDNRSGGLMGNDRTATGSAATSAGRAASAAVTPGDQNMGRNPENRSGGLMGNDRARGARATRADRG